MSDTESKDYVLRQMKKFLFKEELKTE